MRGLLAVLTRAGLLLPPGLDPGTPADRLHAAAGVLPDAEPVEWAGRRGAVEAGLDAVEGGPLGPWLRGPRARALAAAQLRLGVPLAAWGLRHRGGGWVVAGTVLTARGLLGLAYDRLRTRA